MQNQQLPFSSGDLIMGNREGIGLCTLWTPKNKYLDQLPHVQVIGNLYSQFGIGILMRNVLATPSIKTVVVTGKDNPEPRKRQAEALLNGNFNPKPLYLEQWHVDEFYERTHICDARSISVKKQAELTSVLAAAPRYTEGDIKPIIIPLPEVSQETYPTNRSGHVFRAGTIKDAHRALLKEIRTFGEFTQPDSEDHRRQELWQVTVCLSKDCPLDAPLYDLGEIERYGESLWQGDEPEGLTYRYGHTLRRKYGDQMQAALDAFGKKPETFRVVLSLWEPLQSMLRDDEPCLTTIHPRIRNGVLDMYAYIRTNEMFRGWPKNAAGLRFLQVRFAERLGVELGELTITSGSAHLYDLDWPVVDSYLSSPRPNKIRLDLKGDWNFEIEGGKYVAEHYFDGNLLQRFAQSSIEGLKRQILPFISDTSHAVYVGEQLCKLRNEV
ncbi:MAG: hypothetical protein GY928_33705 [Colwellia sp.]|nr:hypothetical protein [Colwellia sp.]